MILEKAGRFDPRNEKYKNAELKDLPKIMQGDYVKAEGGGFISKETAAEQEEFAVRARSINKQRSLKDKILGRNKETSIGLQQDMANAMNDENFPFSSDEKAKDQINTKAIEEVRRKIKSME